MLRRQKLLPELRTAAIEEIAGAPAKIRAALAGLNDSQLDTPYREGGWTVRQVVHHLRRQPHERVCPLASCAHRD